MSYDTARNTAWQNVIDAIEAGQPVRPFLISRNTGVKHDTVIVMASRCRSMNDAGVAPTGDWWHDRVNVKLPPVATVAAA